MRKAPAMMILMIFMCFPSTGEHLGLYKKIKKFENVGFWLSLSISKAISSAYYDVELHFTNRESERINYKNGKIQFKKSSFMFPINGNKLFIVSPLRPCKIEFVGHNERKQLNGIEYASDSVFFYILNVDREMEYVKDKSAHILSYIPFEDDDSSFLGLLYYFKSPIVRFIKLHQIENFILSQLEIFLNAKETAKPFFETRCF